MYCIIPFFIRIFVLQATVLGIVLKKHAMNNSPEISVIILKTIIMALMIFGPMGWNHELITDKGGNAQESLENPTQQIQKDTLTTKKKRESSKKKTQIWNKPGTLRIQI